MILSDFLKAHGIELESNTVPKTGSLSDGVRFLLFLLSRRHSHGRAVSIDETLLKGEWPSSLAESFDDSVKSALERGYVRQVEIGYMLTDEGKQMAR